MTVCKRVLYSGRVQGVGFRYAAHGLARRFDVAGYARNLANGDVELVVEGPRERVDDFLLALGHCMTGYIDQTAVQEEPPGGFREFSIRY